jgi:hypothetical protein
MDEVLGPRELRSLGTPVYIDGQGLVGGTFLERHERYKAVVENTRCCTLSLSYERPRKLVAPTASSKMISLEMDDFQAATSALSKVCILNARLYKGSH